MSMEHVLLDTDIAASPKKNLKIVGYVVGALAIVVVFGASGFRSGNVTPEMTEGDATALSASALHFPYTRALGFARPKLGASLATMVTSPSAKIGAESPMQRLVTSHGLARASAIQAPEMARVKEVAQESLEGEALVSEASLLMMEKEELLTGKAVGALRRFSDALEALPRIGWEDRLRPAFAEMALNLETFNPVFTSCLLQVQMTAGISNYERRDQCLQRLVQPLAGEYGLHAEEPLGKTHRALFREWYESVMGEDEALQNLLEDTTCGAPKAEWLFGRMMSDVETAGQGPAHSASRMEKAVYALGYNLAVEYLANPEKTWLLESFQKFDEKILKPLGRKAEYEFLVVHAIGEKEHAHLGHEAVALFAPASLQNILRQAMRDHDRDLATYYNHLADILEGLSVAKC